MNIYLKAAQLCDATGMCCCWSIDDSAAFFGPTGKILACEAAQNFSKLFSPDEGFAGGFWGQQWVKELNSNGPLAFGEYKERLKWHRVLALCFAAAMHETGDLKYGKARAALAKAKE